MNDTNTTHASPYAPAEITLTREISEAAYEAYRQVANPPDGEIYQESVRKEADSIARAVLAAVGLAAFDIKEAKHLIWLFRIQLGSASKRLASSEDCSDLPAKLAAASKWPIGVRFNNSAPGEGAAQGAYDDTDGALERCCALEAEVARLTVSNAKMVQALNSSVSWIEDCVRDVLYPLAHQTSSLAAVADGFGGASVAIVRQAKEILPESTPA